MTGQRERPGADLWPVAVLFAIAAAIGTWIAVGMPGA